MPQGLTGKTRLIPIIGDPIIYARTPETLTREFAARGQDTICIPMQVPQADLEVVLRGLTHTPNIDGVLVTMPHKLAAFQHCATVSRRSQLLKVVSVLRRKADGNWYGDVLDGLSFVQAQINHGAKPEGAKVLILGAGGAGSAIAIAFLEAGARELVIHDPSETRAGELVRILTGLKKGRVSIGPPDPTGCDMVCNATPMGMSDSDPLPVEVGLLTSSMFVGDVIAGHGETALIRAAHAAGCKTANGDDMVEAVLGITVDFMNARED